MPDPVPRDQKKSAFVAQLLKLADPETPDRAALAQLRRGLATDEPAYTLTRCGWLFRRFADRPGHEAAAVLLAGLFAHVRGKCPQTPDQSVGAALGQLRNGSERRFIDLLDTDREDLPHKLRQAVTLLAANGIGLDWHLLFRHLRHWDDLRKWVQKEWARGYWSKQALDADEPSDPSTD